MIVHIILNSHLDPVWLWKREQGIDEVLNTARTGCDILDRYPELYLTRGEAWFYETVEAIDPALFGRIRRHVATGRWRIVGGWYVQPDCNLASPESYLRHGEYGTRYFREKFGVKVRTGYNVDSFGHSANLPDFYRAAGIENYIMMRPGRHEMALPGETFLWESQHGATVTAGRVPLSTYCTTTAMLAGNLERLLQEADPHLGHVMFFVGLGDHGGGPVHGEIEYLRNHLHYADGVELRFSHPDAYFDAVRASGVELPRYRGELQHHAIGCYSAVSRIKRELRRTENLLIQAERFGEAHRDIVPAAFGAALDEAWRKVLFAGFHDILPGSSIASAYQDIYDDLGSVRAAAREIIVTTSRRLNAALPAAPHQRLIFDNAGAREFDGLVEFEPWLGYRWVPGAGIKPFTLVDEECNPVPYQQLHSEAAGEMILRIAAPLRIPAGGRKILFCCEGTAEPVGSVSVTDGGMHNSRLAADCAADGLGQIRRDGIGWLAEPVRAVLLADQSDTWSHGIDHYAPSGGELFHGDGVWHRWENGPLLGAAFTELAAGDNTLRYTVALAEGGRGVTLKLKLHCRGAHQLIKLLIRPGFPVTAREDGCPGGTVPRRLNGEEYPVFHSVVLRGERIALAAVSCDIFSADVQPDGLLRLTLLRTPCYAHHDPYRLPDSHDFAVTDQGEHEFELSLLPLLPGETEAVSAEVFRRSAPVFFSENTFGVRREA